MDGLPSLSSSAAEISTIASTPQYGLRGDRSGEADHPEPVMEGVRDGRAAWLTDLPKPTNGGVSVSLSENLVLFLCYYRKFTR